MNKVYIAITLAFLSSCGEVRVMDINGNPVVGAQIQLFSESHSNGIVYTDQDGKFDFYTADNGNENKRCNVIRDGYWSAQYFRGDPRKIILRPFEFPRQEFRYYPPE